MCALLHIHIHIDERVFIYTRLFIKLNTSHNAAAHAHSLKHARTPFQISCWRCIIIISSSSSAAVRHCYCYCYCAVLLLLLLMLCYIHTRAHVHTLSLPTPDKFTRIVFAVSQVSRINRSARVDDLHSSSALATSFALARFKYLFSFSLRSASIARYVRLR